MEIFPELTSSEILTGPILFGLALQFPEIAKASKPRYPGNMNDFELTFYSQCFLPEEETALIDRMGLAIDIILRNHNIEKQRRQEILSRFQELCGIWIGNLPLSES